MIATTWWGVIAAIVVAACSGGGVAAVLNYAQTHGKTDAETAEIYARINSGDLAELRVENKRLRQVSDLHEYRAELHEYRFDRLIAEVDRLVAQVAHCPGVNVTGIHDAVIQIKYLDKIPGREPPPPAPTEAGEPA